MLTKKIETPETDKMMKYIEEYHTQNVGDFLSWLKEKEYYISKYMPEGVVLYPVHKSIEEWIADWLEIDLKLIEKERRKLLRKRLNIKNK